MAINNTNKAEGKKSQATITVINGTVVTPAIITEPDSATQETVVGQIVEQVTVEPSAAIKPPEVAMELNLSEIVSMEQVEKMQEYLMRSLEAGMVPVDLVEAEKQFRQDMVKFLNEYGVDGDLDGAISAMIAYLDAEMDAEYVDEAEEETVVEIPPVIVPEPTWEFDHVSSDGVKTHYCFTKASLLEYLYEQEGSIDIFHGTLLKDYVKLERGYKRLQQSCTDEKLSRGLFRSEQQNSYRVQQFLFQVGLSTEEPIEPKYDPEIVEDAMIPKPKKPGFFSRWFAKEESVEQAA